MAGVINISHKGTGIEGSQVHETKRPVDNEDLEFQDWRSGDVVGSISKKYFRPGGMAPSEWTRSVRAVRDTPVADYSARGLNTMRRDAYRPPITVSPFLLALLVSNFKRTLWR